MRSWTWAQGTGHHLAYVLAPLRRKRFGIALDTSTAALRRAARIHPRATAVGADAWKPLPLRDGVAALVLSVFAPRNAGELARILAPGRRAARRHPHDAPPRGARRPARPPLCARREGRPPRRPARPRPSTLTDPQIRSSRRCSSRARRPTQLVRMGPSAWHVDEVAVAEGLAALAGSAHRDGLDDRLGVPASGASAAGRRCRAEELRMPTSYPRGGRATVRTSAPVRARTISVARVRNASGRKTATLAPRTSTSMCRSPNRCRTSLRPSRVYTCRPTPWTGRPAPSRRAAFRRRGLPWSRPAPPFAPSRCSCRSP